jgi:hypothetical protein
MKTNILVVAAALSDQDLLARLHLLAGTEREASAELVAHLAALDTRPAVYAAQAYGSLFSYCTQALRLSEDAACNRIEAARACRRFPVILDLLASGEMTLTSVRLLGRHLTAENHQAVLANASRRSRPHEAIDALLAGTPDIEHDLRLTSAFHCVEAVRQDGGFVPGDPITLRIGEQTPLDHFEPYLTPIVDFCTKAEAGGFLVYTSRG